MPREIQIVYTLRSLISVINVSSYRKRDSLTFWHLANGLHWNSFRNSPRRGYPWHAASNRYIVHVESKDTEDSVTCRWFLAKWTLLSNASFTDRSERCGIYRTNTREARFVCRAFYGYRHDWYFCMLLKTIKRLGYLWVWRDTLIAPNFTWIGLLDFFCRNFLCKTLCRSYRV